MGRKKGRMSRFVAIPWEVIDSKAWVDLTNAARVAYVHMKRQVRSSNSPPVPLSYRKMEAIMNRHTFSSSLKQLEKVGFIKKEQQGGLYRRRNFFRFVDDWKQYNPSSRVKIDTVMSAENGPIEGLVKK